MNNITSAAAPIAINDRLIVAKGCNSLGITKGATVVVKAIIPLGAEYGHSVKITFWFMNSFMAGKTVSFYARHMNRLSDPIISLNNGNPTKKIEVRRV